MRKETTRGNFMKNIVLGLGVSGGGNPGVADGAPEGAVGDSDVAGMPRGGWREGVLSRVNVEIGRALR